MRSRNLAQRRANGGHWRSSATKQAYYIDSLGPQAQPDSLQQVLPQQKTGFAKFIEFKVSNHSSETLRYFMLVKS